MQPPMQDQEIEGVWTVVSAERDGNPAGQFVNAKFTFTAGRFTIQRPGRGMVEGRCQADPTTDPREITLKDPRNPPRMGIYKVEGEELTLCLGEESPPAEFSAEPGSQQTLLVLRRHQP